MLGSVATQGVYQRSVIVTGGLRDLLAALQPIELSYKVTPLLNWEDAFYHFIPWRKQKINLHNKSIYNVHFINYLVVSSFSLPSMWLDSALNKLTWDCL